MYSLLREKASQYEGALTRFAYRLAITPPCSDMKNDPNGDIVISEMNSLGYDRAFRDSYGNITGCIFGRDYSPTLLLISGMAPADCQKINTDIRPGIDENNISAYCTCSSLGALAAQVYAGRLIKECIPMFGNIIVVGTVLENSGYHIGMSQFIRNTLPSLGLNASFAILGEPTDLGLFYCRDGWVCIELKLSGNSVSDVGQAGNALYQFLQKSTATTLTDSEKVEEIIIEKPAVISGDNVPSTKIRLIQRLRNKNELLHHLCRFRETARLVCRPFSNVSVSTGVGRRIIKGIGSEQHIAREFSLPWATDPLNPYFDEARLALRNASCEIRGGTTNPGLLGKYSAGSILTETFGIPAIEYGPGSRETHVNSPETLSIANLNEAFLGTAVISSRITGVPSVNKQDRNQRTYK